MSVISDFFENSVRKFPNKTALIINKKKYTYKELDQLVLSFSSSLIRYPQKSVVSMIFENSLEFIVCYLAILRSGCIAHLISPAIIEHNLEEQMRSACPKAIISSKVLIHKIQKIKTNADKLEFSELLSKKTSIDRKPESNDVAYLIYTSGTTSIPKGVGISHSSVVFTTNNIVSVLKYNESDTDVLPLPLSHSFGLGCMHTSIFVGSTLILHKNTIDMDKILHSIKANNATTFAAVPTTLTKMQRDYPQLKEYISALRLIITNSTTIPITTTKAYFDMLKKGKIATYYGLTEASRSTFMIFDKLNGREESVGLPASGVKIRIVNEKNEESKEGLIWIKGKNVITKYWNNPEADKNIVDGWLRTGDIGYLDSEGYLFLKGRDDDMINVGGEKVIPAEIERVVKVLPEIEEAVAVGVKHELFGQVVKLFVQKSFGTTIQKSDILSHCIKNLERHKVPAQIEFVDEFPRTEYGKIKRFKLE